MSVSSVDNDINGKNKPLRRGRHLAWRKHLASCRLQPVKPWGEYRSGIQGQLKITGVPSSIFIFEFL